MICFTRNSKSLTTAVGLIAIGLLAPASPVSGESSLMPAAYVPAVQSSLHRPFVHHLLAGESLATLGERYYGNRHYALLIELINGIHDSSSLAPGTEIRIPRLDAILLEEGVSTVMPEPVYEMLEARATYMEVESELWSLRKYSDVGYVDMPEHLQAILRKASQTFWDVAMGLRVDKPKVKVVPNRSIGQFKAISFDLRRISYGAIDPFGYDLNKIHQRLSWAICNEIVWARNGYR